MTEGIKFEKVHSFGRLYQLTATMKPNGKAAVVLEAPQRTVSAGLEDEPIGEEELIANRNALGP